MDNRPVRSDIFAQRLTKLIAERGTSCHAVGRAVNLSGGTISRYCNNMINKPKTAVVRMIADHFRVPVEWLMGYDAPQARSLADGVMPVERRRIPLLGQVAAGQPIYTDEQHDCFVEVGADRADFCLRVKGDSMIGARIYNGDIVFIRAQPDVDDGEIAVVLIDDEATLKRVYKLGDRVILRAENPAYPPMEFRKRDGKVVRILGKAIAFQGKL